MTRFRMPLSLKLPLLVVLAVVLTALVGSVAAIVIGRSVLRADTLAQQRDLAGLYASAIQFYVTSARSVLETTASFPLVKSLAVDRRHAGILLRYATAFEYVMLLTADGTVQMLEPASFDRQLSHRNLSFHTWYRDVIVSGNTVVSDLHVSPATQRPTVIIATPVRSPGGDIIGVWAGALNLDELSRLGRTQSIPGGVAGSGYVTDRRGLMIAHQTKPSYGENQTDFSSVPTVRAALAGERGAFQFTNPIEGEEQLGAYRPIESLGWAVAYVVPIKVAFGTLDFMTRGVALASAALAVLMGGIGFVISQRIVRPLKRLTTGTQTIGTGDFSGWIEVQTGDEIEQLAEAFNRMAAALAEQDAQLRRRADELQAANEELEAFSYSVSHDLRAPLRAMDGFSRILLQEEQGQSLSPEARRYLGLVRQNTEQMGRLVDDLLTFSRLGRQALKRTRVVPAELIRHVLEDLDREQVGRHIEIIVGDLPSPDADPALLKQVWLNLLSNALKYTRHRDPARIEVGCTDRDGERAYFVKDNGVGFDMRYADKLFGVFQRLHRAEEYEGTGVGLAIVQRIVHRHGGRVWAMAEEEKGATFYFTLGSPAQAERLGAR